MRTSLVRPLSALVCCAALLCSGVATAVSRPPVHVTGVLNLNTATETELRQLPGVGEKKAARILDLRKKQKFQTTDQLMKVKGFGRLTYRKLKPYLAVSGPTTIKRDAPAPAAPKPPHAQP